MDWQVLPGMWSFRATQKASMNPELTRKGMGRDAKGERAFDRRGRYMPVQPTGGGPP